uniref:Uncharacterized protein n=1 Tax=Magallana gigas TaxID=29159 RepID=K1RCM0_MAGGI
MRLMGDDAVQTGREGAGKEVGKSHNTGYAGLPRTDIRHFDNMRSDTDGCCTDSDIR